MRLKQLLVLSAASFLLTAAASAATIQYSVTPLGGAGLFRYNYSISGITFSANQEVDITFPAALFSNLANPVAGAGFTANVFQPNNPPGFPGDYILLATVNNPSLAGPFSVDFKYLGSGSPGSQAFEIDQFDSNGNFQGVISTGTTVLAGGTAVPEPTSAGLIVIGMLAGGGWAARRRFFRAA